MRIDNLASQRIGQTNRNHYGTLMEVVSYNNTLDILVRFEYGDSINSQYGAFKDGRLNSRYDKTAYGVGYIGEGLFKPTNENGKQTDQYVTWIQMIRRCYDEKYHKKYPTYISCSVTEEWHNYQTFAKWYDENYYEIGEEEMGLDKDILIKGNKLYSPDTCIFVPVSINSLFVKNDSSRGNLPLGVTFHKRNRRFNANYNTEKQKSKHIGSYSTPEEAFIAYKIHKEKYIQDVAGKYRNKIPVKLFEAMMKYEVEITD